MQARNIKRSSQKQAKPHKHLSIFSLGGNALIGVDIGKDLRLPMFNVNHFSQLSTEAAENSARLVLNQLSERLNFYRHQSESDDEMECLQFGICSYQPQPNRVII